MVRKVTGDRPSQGTSAVQPTRTVESTKIDGVEQVRGAERQAGLGAIRRSTRQLTAEQQRELLAMVDEEAEKMFSQQGIPEAKKETVKGAVRMAIQASMIEGDEEE